MDKKLSPSFLNEVFKLMLSNKNFYLICQTNLKFEYLPTEEYKRIFQEIKNFYKKDQLLPTIGILSERIVLSDSKKQDLIDKTLLDIKKAELPYDYKAIIEQLETYIKYVMSSIFFSNSVEDWNKNKKDKVVNSIYTFAQQLQNFSLVQNISDNKVIADFDKRLEERIAEYHSNKSIVIKKAYHGIDQLDELTGGIEETDMVGFVAQSGVGKSICLKWIGMNNAINGLDVLHYQLEGSKKEAEIGYERIWTGINKQKLQNGLIEPEELEELRYAKENILGDITLESAEMFGKVSTLDIRNAILDYQKINGKFPKVLIIDYLELLIPGLFKNAQKYDNGAFGEKMRRRLIAQELKNIAMEFNLIVFVAIQASAVSDELLQNPDFVMTRFNASGDKNIVDPFSYFYTLNQTRDEYFEDLMRIYVDKLRHSKAGRNESEKIIKIYQNYDNGRFYNRERTMKEILNRW